MTVYSAYSSVVSTLTLVAGRNPVQPRLYLLQPTVVMAGQVVLLDPADYPISFFAYDNVTVGDYTAVRPGMTVIMGTVPGSDNLGRQRVRGPETPATTISIFVGRSSRGNHDGELTIVDNAYFEIWDDFRVWSKIPFIDSSGEIFKDSSLEVGDRTEFPPPVAIMGEGDARTIDPDTGVTTVLFNGQPSYAVADGATITDWLWDIADCALSSGALTDDNITILCPPGFRHISLTVTDSNGKTATTRRPVLADDPDDRLSFDGFAIESRRHTDAGQTMTIRILEDMPRATYPDNTLCMVWDAEPVGASNRDHMLIVGWLDSEDVQANAGRNGLLRDTTITIQDVAQRLDTLPGFPQSLADDDTRDEDELPDITWNYMVAPTMDKYVHYLLAWHSTALEVADFYWSDTGSNYRVAIKSSDGESLWNQVARTAGDMLPGYVLTCEPAGRIRMVPDPMLQDSADRTDIVQADISEDEWSDIRFTYRRAPTVHWLRAGALVTQSSITFNADGTVFLPTVFSIAPGDTPGQGLGEVENNEGLVASQAVLNATTGHKYARLNNPVGLITVTLVQDDSSAVTNAPWSEINLALKEWVTLTMSAATAAQRGLTFTTARCLPKELNIRYNQGKAGLTRTLELTLEVETSGEPGNTVTKPDIPAVGDDPATLPDPIPPPDMGLVDGQELIALIGETSLYRTDDFQTDSGSGGPTWEEVSLTADTSLTWVVDPFSPGYLTGTGAVNGWRATTTKIYRIADIFGSTSETAIVTFANTALWRTIQASFGTYFVEGENPWLMCVSYYGDLVGHTGTWATYSQDGGATWSAEVQITAHYDTGGAVHPIALYLSPKTPGLAYTFAYTATADPAPASGYSSPTWGASWAAKPTLDPGIALGGDIHVPWLSAGDDTIYHGKLGGGTETDPDLLPGWGLFNDNTLTFAPLSDGPTKSASVLAHDETAAGPTPNDEDETYLCIVAPADTVRLVYRCVWDASKSRAGGSSTVALTLTPAKHSLTSTSGTSNFVAPASYPSTSSGSFVIEVTFSGVGDWPCNKDSVISSPPTALNQLGPRVRLDVIASCFGAGNFAEGEINITMTVLEIELDDATIYTPVSSSERMFTLQRVTTGAGIEDVSPSSSGVFFGPHAQGFAIRAFDSDEQYMAAGATGNDTTADVADDTVGLWVSSNAGVAWTNILAPVAASNALYGLHIAFSGEDSNILYAWGGWADGSLGAIYYSDDLGASLDDRTGDISGHFAALGICGGPTP